MRPLSIQDQISRQIQKGCRSQKDNIERYLKTASYYTINYDYEPYLYQDNRLSAFTIKDYKWLEETNDRVAKEALSLILRAERIVRNKIADYYSFYCTDNSLEYFSEASFFVDAQDFKDAITDESKSTIKTNFIQECFKLYNQKKKSLHHKYHFDRIHDVPPFVIAQHLTFGQIRKFYKLLNKDIKERIVQDFKLRISEFNSLIERLNFLRNSCAHGEFILNFRTLKGKKIINTTFHNYIYNNHYILNKNTVGLLPLLSQCSYLLDDNLDFYISTMRNILEITNYSNKGSINNSILIENLGLVNNTKTVQSIFVKF